MPTNLLKKTPSPMVSLGGPRRSRIRSASALSRPLRPHQGLDASGQPAVAFAADGDDFAAPPEALAEGTAVIDAAAIEREAALEAEVPVDAAEEEENLEFIREALQGAQSDGLYETPRDTDEEPAEEEGSDEEEPAAAEATPRARNVRGAPGEPTTYLAMYFREMAALDVMEPQEEFRAAREIEGLEIVVWERIFSFPPLTDHLLRVVETVMENSLAEFRALRRSAADQRRGARVAGRPGPASRRACERVRALDIDKQYLTAVLTELSRIARGHSARPAAEPLRFSPRGEPFAAYLRRVGGAADAAARARNDFVKANLRLVVSIARRFNHGRMALADLIQEGNIGLMKAVERYDYRRGFRFSTYASWWIRHAISRALADKGREVRLPVHMIDAYHRIAKAKRELTAKLGRQPTSDEVAEATSIDAAKIEKMRTYLLDQSVSLDRPVNDDDGRHLVELLHDPNDEDSSPIEGLADQTVTSELHRLLRDLKPIEADILRQRFGLDDDREQTLKEIGEKYNLSRERIRQLQEQALGKMRRALQRKDLL